MVSAPPLAVAARSVGADPDALLAAFTSWAEARGLSLYPAQEEALIEIFVGNHVILNTPTGSGKSLVAIGAHFAALAEGKRSFYLAPLKALVSEKFFSLIEIFGAANVGMITGDSAVNPEAPIICATSEILANMALRGSDRIDQVVMDEFHFYADPQRGWAWQIPLLQLPETQFIMMSATLGDVAFFEEDMLARTGREVSTVTSTQRPVPLTFEYSLRPLPELLEYLTQTGRSPVYVVHFTQASAIERAQTLLGTKLIGADKKERIAQEIGAFRFSPGFGVTLSKLVRAGIGVHHAGMLPKYRRLVERLTQAGLLAVICGTDTLGVGINVPIRTVVFTSLVKYDGVKSRHLTAREFHQIAGRAGRAGFDTEGEVIVQAPDHVIENAKLLAKAGDDEKKRRKIVRKKAPDGAVNWTDKTFERLRDAEPEALTSQFQVSHGMVLQVLAREGDAVEQLAKLLTDNHDSPTDRNPHLRRAVGIYRSLRAAGVIERDPETNRWKLAVDLPDHFALNQPLSPFALAALELLDVESPTFALDVISVIEATLDDPRPVLSAQQFQARGEAVAALKAEGFDYDERMAMLEDVSYPKPLAELLEAALAIYRKDHPWVADYELSPKSVVRDMVERAMTFGEFISVYKLARSEGVVLRYLTDAYRTLRQIVPEEMHTEELNELIEWLGEVVRGVDSSLLEEWEQLRDPSALAEGGHAPSGMEEPPVRSLTSNKRAFTVMVRNAMFKRVDLASREDYDALGRLDGASGWDADRWAAALDPFYDDHDEILVGPNARSPKMMIVTELAATDDEPARWQVRQILDEDEGDHDWHIEAVVDLEASDLAGEVVLGVVAVGA